MSRQKILTLSGDPGGARALAPAVAVLGARGHNVLSYTYRHASDVFAELGLPFTRIEETATVETAEDLINQAQAALVFTATSANGVDLEKRFIAAAGRLGVPSVSVLDFWTNYRLRFSSDSGNLAFVPNAIAVPDIQARDEMIEVGFEPDRLIVTGQPAFDDLRARRRLFDEDQRRLQRSVLGVEPDELLVLFASQPLSQLYGSDSSSPRYLGYTQESVLHSVVTSLDQISRQTGARIALLVRPHPREIVEQHRFSSSSVRLLFSANGSGLATALAADVLVGMTTILLIEAALAGCLVVSVQPGGGDPRFPPSSFKKYISVVRNYDSVTETLRSLLLDHAHRRACLSRLEGIDFATGSAERVASLVESYLVPRAGYAIVAHQDRVGPERSRP